MTKEQVSFPTRVTFRLDQNTKNKLRNIQRTYHSLSMSEVLRHGIIILEEIHRAKRNQEILFVRNSDGLERQLIF